MPHLDVTKISVQAGVYVDRSKSGPYSNNTMQGGVIPLQPAGLQASAVTLRVFVDHSMIEVTCTALYGVIEKV